MGSASLRGGRGGGVQTEVVLEDAYRARLDMQAPAPPTHF